MTDAKVVKHQTIYEVAQHDYIDRPTCVMFVSDYADCLARCTYNILMRKTTGLIEALESILHKIVIS